MRNQTWLFLFLVLPLAQACVPTESASRVVSSIHWNCKPTNVPAANSTFTGTFVTQRAEPCDFYYNYAPEVLFDGATYHMYWCAGIGDVGDNILHAESTSATGPFHAHANAKAGTYDISLTPSKQANTFDQFEACDPNVLFSNGTYYLYYGGLATQVSGQSPTTIGLATSSDGITFTRTGTPLVTPAHFPVANPALAYGAGQPTVIYYQPYFYMLFTDSTAPGSNPVNGAGQYLIRSASPTFSNPQEMVSAGTWANFQPGARQGIYSLMEAFSVDMAVDPSSGKVVIANDTNNGPAFFTGLYYMDPKLFGSSSFEKPKQLSGNIPGTWRDGPGLVKQPDHTLPARPACNSLPVRVYKGDTLSNNAGDVKTWDLSTNSAVVDASALCP